MYQPTKKIRGDREAADQHERPAGRQLAHPAGPPCRKSGQRDIVLPHGGSGQARASRCPGSGDDLIPLSARQRRRPHRLRACHRLTPLPKVPPALRLVHSSFIVDER
jgi:hypothetical protein